MGIDLGTSSVKVLVVDDRGRILAQASGKYPILTPYEGFAEQDPGAWWGATKEAVRRVLSSERVDCGEIEAIGLSGQMHGTVVLGKGLNPLRNAIIWADSRSGRQCDEIRRKLGDERIREILCNPIMPGFMAPSLLWIKENEPSIFEEAYRVVLPKDYIRLCLTGDIATDFSDASATLLFDVKRRCWSSEVLSELGIDEELLPQVYESVEVVGEVSPEAARETGLPKDIKVVAGGGDSPVSAVGCGVIKSGLISVNIGSAGQVFTVIDDIRADPKLRIHTFCHAVPSKWYLQGAILSAGLTLDWFIKSLGFEELLSEKGINAYSKLVEEAAGIPAGSAGLIFLPYLLGERSPHMDPSARGAFFGLRINHGRGHLVRAVMEGVAFALRDCYEVFKELGITANELLIRGGGGRIPLWRQIIADVFGCRILAAEVEEAAYGAALLASVGAGIYKNLDDAVKKTISLKVFEEPGPDQETYDRLYREIYSKLYPAVKELFKALTGLDGKPDN
jgi:xylulokinase